MQPNRFVNLLYIFFAQLVLVIVTLPAEVNANEAISDETQVEFIRSEALKDPHNRISADFKVPAALEKRTAFWFDVYTQYGSNHHVIHHVLYPWIVYKVVDTSKIENSNMHKWTKYHAAQKLVRNEKLAVLSALKKLSTRTSYKKLPPLERQIYSSLWAVQGSRRKVIKEAYENVRVQLGQKDFFISGLESSSKYLPTLENVFSSMGVPTELTRIPFVESSFNVDAQSKVGASGIWQIMPTTARGQLILNTQIDERNSPLKASIVAANLLKHNYRVLEQWPLAVTAYNHGASGIRSALRKSKTSNLSDLVAQYHAGSFRFASANFYTSFLAALHAEKYHSEIFKDHPYTRKPELQYRVVSLSHATRVQNILKETGLTKEILFTYNLDLKSLDSNKIWLPRGYKLILPANGGAQAIRFNKGSSRLFKEAALVKGIKTSG